MTLGPYASVLSYILTKAKSKTNSEAQFTYRGMRIPRCAMANLWINFYKIF